jgi:hypothetical protein
MKQIPNWGTTILEWRVILIVTWHFLLDACEMIKHFIHHGAGGECNNYTENIRCHGKNLICQMTRQPGFVHPCCTVYVNYFFWRRVPPIPTYEEMEANYSSCILDTGTRWWRVVSFMPWLLYPRDIALTTQRNTSWRALLEKLRAVKLVIKCPIFYETWRPLTVFTTAKHWSLVWANRIQPMSFHSTAYWIEIYTL